MPGDAEDDESDRQSDQRVGDVQPDRDNDGAEDDAEADEAVGATRACRNVPRPAGYRSPWAIACVISAALATWLTASTDVPA